MTLETSMRELTCLLRLIEQEYAPAVFANSFGAEDMVLTDAIARGGHAIGLFTLDTGRLPEETYRLMHAARERYRLPIQVYCPDARALEQYQNEHGPDAFYRSVELRKRCCHVRKVEPLRRALAGQRAWLTGLRREQAPTRKDLRDRELDPDNGLHKFNPLIDWSAEEVWEYIRRFEVPYNSLHDRGYPSIGCAPCTRSIAPGEDVRAGRWWWESPESKECGLHATPADRRVPAVVASARIRPEASQYD